MLQPEDSAASRCPTVAVVGCGRWGRNLVRNFAELGALHSVCDIDQAVAQEFSQRFNVPALSLDSVLQSDCDGTAFASPAALHAQQSSMALAAGKHVFVEKPLALTVGDGQKVKNLAKSHNKILMVGHLLHYHPLVIELIRLIHSGRLGVIKHIVANRLNFGTIRLEEDVIWSFAPHDLSIILAIFDQVPTRVSVEATAILNPKLADVASMHLDFAGGSTARVTVSWLNPYKEQKLSVIGTEGHMVFDDTLEWDQKLVIYDHKVDLRDGRPVAIKAKPTRITVPQKEPLKEECAHFLTSIRQGSVPRTDVVEALRVLAVLEAATRARRTGRSATPFTDREIDSS